MVNTANPPPVPNLISPANGVFVTGVNIRLDWSTPTNHANFAYYQLQVSRFSDFSLIYIDWPITDWSQSELTLAFDGGTDYYWRVRAFNTDNEYSTWSTVKKFRLYLQPPVLVTPANHSNPGEYPTFYWGRVSGATSYTLKVWYRLGSAYPKTLWFTVTSSSNSFTSPVKFPVGITYYWQVQATGKNGKVLSETWDFFR
jgi:hypothetical protein